MDYICRAGEKAQLIPPEKHPPCILGISWQDKLINADVLSRTGLPTMYTLLRQRRLPWLGHVRPMEDGRIPKEILYGELALGRRWGEEPPAALTCDIKMSA